jgi:Imelysin
MTLATEVRIQMIRPALAAAVCALALALVACGDDDKSDGSTTSEATAQGTDLGAIKDYLLSHTERLVGDSGAVRENAEAYYELAKSNDFDYAALLDEHRAEVRRLVVGGQEAFAKANPAYEQMEGVVAGVPSLADYDVIIDAGSDASDPENAVPFDVETPAGRTFKQPGNFNYLIETSVFGTEPKFAAKGVEPDLDGDGKVEFGEAVPDADFYVAAARGFEKYSKELDAAARDWQPTGADALTALVVMTPTMSEYFAAWKNSRFIAGDKATEKAFVAASRLQDIADILGGLVLVYDNVEPLVAKADAEQATQTKQSLTKLHAFAAELRDKEAGGRRYTAEEADTLGSQAQERAEAIAGQITQAAAKLDIEIQEG